MTLYAVYRISDGALVSIGTVLASNGVLESNGYTYIELSIAPGPFDVWNPVTHTFDTMPTPKEVLTKQQFVERFTEAEWEDLQAYPTGNAGTAIQRKRVNGGLKRLEWVDEIDMNLAKNQNAINYLETIGIIGAGRAAQIIG
jgi:hypothetical protein